MSLKLKVLTTIFTVVILYTAMDYAIHRFIIFPSYLDLEKTEAVEDINRCIRALRGEIDHLDMFTNDWAAWDDTYRFIQDRNTDYITSNLGHQTFVDNELNAIWICNTKGQVIWGEWHDLVSSEIIQSPDLDCNHLALTRHTGTDSSIAGVHLTLKGPMLIASRPVITSERTGAIRGALIMGRLLTPEIMQRLVARTQVEHRIFPIRDAEPAAKTQHDLENITPDRPILHVTGNNRLTVYAAITDLKGVPALLVRAEIPRDIIAKGAATMRYAVISNLIAGFLLLTVLLVLFQRIIRPITDLTQHAVMIHDTGDLSLRYGCGRRDEIGLLTCEFDRMVDQLQSSHQDLEALVAAKTADLRLANQQLTKEVDVRKQAQAALHEAHNRLELEVKSRTAELRNSNTQLTHEIEERRQAEIELQSYHDKLRSLSSELLLAEEGERRRIASELHDRICQALTISKIQLDALSETASGSDLGNGLEEIGSLIDDIIQDTRRLTFELSPPILYELGLEEALEWLVEQFQEKHGLQIRFDNDLQHEPSDNSCRILLFQACRELLFNIVKHARAHLVVVAIKRLGNKVEIVITDDGIGFDPLKNGVDAAKNSGFGLFSIRERLHHLDGSMHIVSAPGQGTRIRLMTPLDEHHERQI